MEIKVLCDCQAKFKFDIEPLNGRMPVPLACPVCGADATEHANRAIAEKLAANPPPPTPPAPAAAPMRVEAHAPANRPPVPVVATAAAAPLEADVPRCAKHPNEISAAECAVCAKPICHRCMEQFGFLCSTYCKAQAEARHIHVPAYAGKASSRHSAEARSHNLLLIASIALALTLVGGYIWYWFIGSRPKLVYKIESGETQPFMASDWIDQNRFFAVTPSAVTMFNAADGSQLWTTDLPKGEIKATKGPEIYAKWVFSFEPIVKVANNDIWIALPTRVLRIETQTGKKKQEIVLPTPASDYRFSDTHLLAVSETLGDDAKQLTRIDLASGKSDTAATPSSSGARRIVGNVRPNPGVANTSLRNLKPGDPGFEDFNDITYSSDPDFIFTGPNVAHITRSVAEQRIAVQAGVAAKTGPLAIDSGNLRASQGNAAAMEFLGAGGTPDIHIDQSLYNVTIRRYFAGAPEFKAQTAGRPYFFAQPNIDLIVGGKTLIALDKKNRKLWEKKLNHVLNPDLAEDELATPALEAGNRLILATAGDIVAFDMAKGETLWTVEAAGASAMALDRAGHLYASASTAGAEFVKANGEIHAPDADTQLLKINLSTGQVLWRTPRVGAGPIISGPYVYTQDGKISGVDIINAAQSGEDPEIHWRLYRIDPKTGARKWELYKQGPPESVHPREKRLLLRFKQDIRLMKYL